MVHPGLELAELLDAHLLETALLLHVVHDRELVAFPGERLASAREAEFAVSTSKRTQSPVSTASRPMRIVSFVR